MNYILELDGTPYPFRIGIAALVRAEQISGKSLLTGFEPSLEVFAAMGYGGMFAADSSFAMLYEEYLNLLTPAHLETIINAYQESMPKQDSSAKKKQVTRKKPSPGKKSTASASDG